LIVVNGEVDREIQFSEQPVEGDPNIVGIVITVADEGKNTRTVVIGSDATALVPWIQEDSP